MLFAYFVFLSEHFHFARNFMSVMAFIYIILCLLTGYAGRNRSSGFIGFTIFSLILTPFIIWIVLLVSGPKTVDAE